jgi:2-dehydro-3-deoxyphosphogluconate aldolase/(4S)-4-hydroxy-2-oxoglutarate aldolase
MNPVFEKLTKFRIIPVIEIKNSKDSVTLGEALIKGGLPVAEITYRTAAAEKSIKALKTKLPEIYIGAGTVLTIDQVKSAIDSGARFLVSPGFNPRIVDFCLDNNITIIPGINTPSDIEQALERGLKHLKFFPAVASGGLIYMNAIAAPFVDVKFMPTGGINQNNVKEYLENKHVFACGGSWMTKTPLISEGRFEEIESLVRQAVEMVEGL